MGDDKFKPGKRLREWRKSRGLEPSDVASAIDVEKPTYTRYETGSRRLRVETVLEIADAFDERPAAILGDVSDEYEGGRESGRAEARRRLRQLIVELGGEVTEMGRMASDRADTMQQSEKKSK